jgi:hypothetical protein
MDTKLINPSTTAQKQEVTFTCPIPKAVIPFLERMKVGFRETHEPCMLSNMVMVEIEIKSGFDLTSLIYAGWEHGFDDHYTAAKKSFTKKTSVA